MSLFQDFIKVMIYVSVAFMAIEIYLTLNKLWKRKHERVVAESISISAKFFSLFPIFVFTTDFVIKSLASNNPESYLPNILSNLMLIFFIGVQIAIGAGIWVAEQRHVSFWTLLKEALRLEKEEVGDLANSLFHPHSAAKILKVISMVAVADGHLDEKEKSFIKSFADSWGLHVDFNALEKEARPDVNLDSVRQSMVDFLGESPPKELAMQLVDVLNLLVKIDGNVSSKEEMMLEELTGLVNRYVNDGDKSHMLYVAVVPQSPDQEKSILNLIPKLVKKPIAGGYAFVTGPFFSEKYAQIICEEYRAFQFFSVTVMMDLDNSSANSQ